MQSVGYPREADKHGWRTLTSMREERPRREKPPLFELHAVHSPAGCLRITECFGLEGAFRGHLAQGYLQLDQTAQSTVQPGLECFQGWGLQEAERALCSMSCCGGVSADSTGSPGQLAQM